MFTATFKIYIDRINKYIENKNKTPVFISFLNYCLPKKDKNKTKKSSIV